MSPSCSPYSRVYVGVFVRVGADDARVPIFTVIDPICAVLAVRCSYMVMQCCTRGAHSHNARGTSHRHSHNDHRPRHKARSMSPRPSCHAAAFTRHHTSHTSHPHYTRTHTHDPATHTNTHTADAVMPHTRGWRTFTCGTERLQSNCCTRERIDTPSMLSDEPSRQSA